MAAELGITVTNLVVVEAQADAAPRQDVGRAWDNALGRILRARRDAVQDEAKDATAQHEATPEGDALRRWGERRDSHESARSARTAGHTPANNAEPATVPVAVKPAKKRQKRPT